MRQSACRSTSSQTAGRLNAKYPPESNFYYESGLVRILGGVQIVRMGHEPPPPIPSPDDGKSAGREWNRAQRVSAIVSGLVILIYAGFFRWAFATPWMQHSGGVVSLSFIFSVPLACGALSVGIGRIIGSDKWVTYAVIVPGVALTMGLLICLLTKIEAVICVIMALPFLFGGSVLGGWLAHALLPKNSSRSHLQVTFAVFIPFIAAWVEGSMNWPSETKAITNTIVIEAPADKIWPEIASVDAIKSEQIRDSWIYWIGFPKPIAATLDHHRVGGVRIATFERGVSFFEEVTEWDQPRKLSFTIHADPAFIPQTAFDQHIIVGGRFYDVLDGTYEIEQIGTDRCRLHLTSNHRLSTRFNAYATWWSERIMDQIQGSILEVIRRRAEGER